MLRKKILLNLAPIKILGVIIFYIGIIFVPSECWGSVQIVEPEPTVIDKVFNSPAFYFILFFGYFIINFIILAVTYLILRLKELVKSLRFLKYVFFATLGGLLINFIFIYLIDLAIDGLIARYGVLNNPLSISTFVIFSLLILLALLFYNYWLARRLLNLTKKQAFVIGIIMGIFSNPVFLSHFLNLFFVVLFMFYPQLRSPY